MDGLLSRLIALLILLLLVITKCNTGPEILLPDMLTGQKKNTTLQIFCVVIDSLRARVVKTARLKKQCLPMSQKTNK